MLKNFMDKSHLLLIGLYHLCTTKTQWPRSIYCACLSLFVPLSFLQFCGVSANVVLRHATVYHPLLTFPNVYSYKNLTGHKGKRES